MELIFASHNENKVKEIRNMVSEEIRIHSLNDLNFHEEIEETGNTLEANARIKAKTIHGLTGKNVFADDSGLFVEALGGAPGVFSSRYAGTGDSEDNINKLLKELEKESNRNAYFKSVFCLILNDEEYFFHGECHGEIISEKRGCKGFGYDPVFIPTGYQQTFSEMESGLKNSISHRYKAVQKLITFIQNFPSCL